MFVGCWFVGLSVGSLLVTNVPYVVMFVGYKYGRFKRMKADLRNHLGVVFQNGDFVVERLNISSGVF